MAQHPTKAWVLESQKDDLSGLVLKDVALTSELGDYDVHVNIRAASLNYRDIMIIKVDRSTSTLIPV